MKNFSKFLTVIILVFAGLNSHAQIRISDKLIEAEKAKQNQTSKATTNSEAVKIDRNYPDKIKADRKVIKDELEKTDDPKRKNEFILKLHKIDNSYYDPRVRTEMIRKKYPGYAARIDAYSSLSKEQRQEQLMKAEYKRIEISPAIRGSLESRWDNVSEWEKKYHCKKSVKECFANQLLKCRFVLDRCYEYVDKQTFKKVRMMFLPQR